MAFLSVGERSDSCLALSPSSSCTISPTRHGIGGSPVLHVPRLEFESFDTMPFSASFSNLFEAQLEDSQTSMVDDGNISYDIERFTNLKELDSEWDDDDVDEIVIMAPKSSSRLPTIVEDLSEVDTFPKQTVMMSDFELLEFSSHAKFTLCRNRHTNRLYALKTFSNCAESDAAERNMLSKISNIQAPFLHRELWSFHEEESFHVVSDYYPRGNLCTLLARHGALRSDHALFYASEIMQGIWALHSAGIVHRDLSAENIAMDAEGHMVLTGLEYAKNIQQLQEAQHKDLTFATGGAKENHSPELLLGWTHDFAVDCWGFGILLHLLLSGVHPFRGDNSTLTREYLLKKIVRDPITFHPLLEPAARNLISKCLERNPVVRLSVTATRRHDYFSTVKWDAVAAKQLQVPRFVDTTDHNKFGARDCNNTDKVTYGGNTYSERRHSQSVECTLTGKPIVSSSSRKQYLQELPKVFRMSSLLDDIPESAEDETPLNLMLGSSVHGPLIRSSLSCDNLTMEVAAKDRMAQFWETLDDQPSILISPSLDAADVIAPRPRKLRKARSSIDSEQRFSALSTASLHIKLRRRTRTHSGLSLTHEDHEPKSPVLELPTGVQKIGSGIGFTYTLPPAARSKASICSNVPSACHNMLHTRLPGLALGLRLANDLCKTITKSKTKAIPPYGDRKSSNSFSQGSQWSLVLPIARAVDPLSALALSDSNSSSPISDAGPLTPDTLGFKECGVVMKSGFEEEVAYEVREGDPVSTLRLVSPSTFLSLER